MKTLRKTLTAAPCLLMAFTLGAGIAQAASEPIQITWWHAMGGDLGKEVNRLADEFNQSQSKYAVEPVYKGTYTQTMTQAIAAFRAHKQPDILQVFDVGTGTMIGAKKAIVPVYKMMKQAGVDFSASDYIPGVRSYYTDSQGHMLSLPFNSSTPVLYYNKDAFEKADIEKPPETWQALYQDAKKLKESGAECGYTTGWMSWINLENFAAWHDVPFATQNNGFDSTDAKLLINKKPFVTQIKRLGKMAQEGLFKYGGRADKPTPLFLSGTCAMYTYSSGSLVSLVDGADFDVGVSMMPYDSDIVSHPQNSIVGGASLWVLSGNPDDHYPGIAKFLTFLSQPEQQAEWSQNTGYVPITQAAYELNKKQGYYKDYPGAAVAPKELSLNEPTANSKGIRLGNFVQIREIINQELEGVWSGDKSAQAALDAAVERGNQQLQRFHDAH